MRTHSAVSPLIGLLALLSLTPTPTQAETQAKTLRVYFIGNSITDTINYSALAEMVKAKGNTMTWGRHMIPGCPLFGLWRTAERKPNDCGFVEQPYGGSINALKNFEWDAVTLQPFDRHLTHADPQSDNDEGDVLYAQKYLDLAIAKSPNARIFIYERWPRMCINGKGISYDKNAYKDPEHNKDKVTDLSKIDDFEKSYLQRYTAGWDDTNETQDYFETLTRILRKVNPYLAKPVSLVPVGDVMYALDQKMKAGQVPGYTSIYQLYADGIHLDNIGSYVVGCTFYATLFQENPKWLPGEPYKVTDPQLEEIIQETVWAVVYSHPYAGLDQTTQAMEALQKASPPSAHSLAVLKAAQAISQARSSISEIYRANPFVGETSAYLHAQGVTDTAQVRKLLQPLQVPDVIIERIGKTVVALNLPGGVAKNGEATPENYLGALANLPALSTLFEGDANQHDDWKLLQLTKQQVEELYKNATPLSDKP